RYRPGLPNVLHAISLKIQAGEKIGVVGCTGTSKSSLTLCLLRIVEYLGEIIVDEWVVSIEYLFRLTDLRSNIAIIPQEVCTVRTALDPFSKYDDARLWDALRHSYLTEPAGEHRHRLTLSTVPETDGQNLSIGERSLLSLARALVKDSRVVILDEATASVDLEMDNNIQRTIQTQFKDRTLICIAHRLRTILSYDRILVLDAGKIVEFDTPLNLFNRNESLFRSLCDKTNTVSFHSIRRSRVTGGPDGNELWWLSRVTKAVEEYIFCHGFPRKWLQSHIESAKIILEVRRLEIEQSDPFSSDFPHGSQVSTRNLTKIN
ncbi:P-loop containing nucleoside triphosphate hydrolase protein, partial [Mycena leptocephala]